MILFPVRSLLPKQSRARESRTKREQLLTLSIVIPTLNVAHHLPATMAALRAAGALVNEILVVDGGSQDDTIALAEAAGVRVLAAARGRGGQLARGAATARGDWFLLLHADTVLAANWAEVATTHMRASPEKAGYFRFALDSADPRARRLERAVAWRCRTLALPYGDQGLLIHRDLLRAVGGVRDLPLMEDVDLIRRLGRRRLVLLGAEARTSAEKWERDGWHRRSVRNLVCLTLYFLGMPPRTIARLYA